MASQYYQKFDMMFSRSAKCTLILAVEVEYRATDLKGPGFISTEIELFLNFLLSTKRQGRAKSVSTYSIEARRAI